MKLVLYSILHNNSTLKLEPQRQRKSVVYTGIRQGVVAGEGLHRQGKVVGDVEIVKMRIHGGIDDIEHIDDGQGRDGNFHKPSIVVFLREDGFIGK